MSKLLNFRASQPFTVRNKSVTQAEIMLYGAIGESYFEDSISAKRFSEELSKLPATVNEIHLRINSPGGDVFDGVTIYNRLKQHKAKVTVYIDGLAASIASIIALAGDDIIMGEGALYMVHLPWTMALGNRNDLDNVVNRLMDIEEQMVGIYSRRSGIDRGEIKAMLEKETWLDSEQALKLGFVTAKMEETTPIAASMLDKASWINKRPKMQTQEEVVKKEIARLQNKVSGILARKKA